MAASKSHSSLLPLLAIFVILLTVTGQAFAGRNAPKQTNKDEKKEPQFLFGHDGSFLIPGFGRVAKPYKFFPYRPPYTAPRTGGSTGTGASPPGRNYVPGGDDTFVPNPGFEVPNPGHP
ncbi:PREDICTED: putative cell wall protein [Fragaria vesca subsp. vesca]|uniref:putative cell wall protein n=1 Tax=Fragaria vesca subsp. vesca TaxID=101020 RepID=UPI0002C33877|nr:PREDICTED: putative cell wall protein [Fragaria vesca subsp. vesca]